MGAGGTNGFPPKQSLAQAGDWGALEFQLGHAVRAARARSRAGEGQEISMCPGEVWCTTEQS